MPVGALIRGWVLAAERGTSLRDAIEHLAGRTRTDRMREDGGLHGWTRVDVLPAGMQEVSGSSPLSSTGQNSLTTRRFSGAVPDRFPRARPGLRLSCVAARSPSGPRLPACPPASWMGPELEDQNAEILVHPRLLVRVAAPGLLG